MKESFIQPTSSFAITVFAIIIGLVILLALAKKTYYFLFQKKRYYTIPRFSVIGMTNVAMVIAIAVAIILLISAITGGLASILFRVYPGTRVSIETILVKISGLLFGPIIGMISGIIIDLLAVTLSAGFFHYGYFVVAILTGMLSGMIRSLLTTSKYSKYRNFSLSIYLSLLVILSFLVTTFLISSMPEISVNKGFDLSIPGISQTKLSSVAFTWIILGFGIGIIAFVWITFLIYKLTSLNNVNALSGFTHKREIHCNHKHIITIDARKNWYSSLISLVCLAGVNAVLVNLFFLPIFDKEITGQPYPFWISIRLIANPALFLIDIIVIYPVIMIIQPIMKYNYEDELTEDLNTPLFIKNWTSRKKGSNMKINKEDLKKLSKLVKFELDEEQIEKLQMEFDDILSNFKEVEKLDTSNIKSMNYPISNSSNQLRDDDVVYLTDKEIIQKTAKETLGDFVKV
ncbi:Asp-tRNA(Asn)/Glu-tRNA(Gln) amidotransferase subunit GatC [Mycoplasma bradburyae]|uniref:Asp-tRNA(Asn)/Glu-tRNA(Gln) amidotransferase subunit GatC n=1 Tax=Mycoplasma bradburyae TaxID=2963128 RepID=UPI00233F9F2F|nr:Asp-tRNA(Asn)/Glu-tRNA(Gln) amidotransferase subunit GatC [Mycoplasma bradburyae]MDC4162987.1 Asp-tRNA(Asn)/Glu-tRNA(Gln) amidotransferase subunit GatC [Mycoplasma bradburyae]MDC4182324.1 Asp-tRNA(Asn)/Glu-tRNA(Gln) amidotransferase subunit GatC [Mycoplasma bradburyae]MDC4183769.1 Asp-tRNA(Asn)/Glu-tRNA(Gln) amidotransferase subunit GatC [Mycoplasma bradburyae]